MPSEAKLVEYRAIQPNEEYYRGSYFDRVKLNKMKNPVRIATLSAHKSPVPGCQKIRDTRVSSSGPGAGIGGSQPEDPFPR